MRQIKFRGRSFSGEWVYGSLLQSEIAVNDIAECEIHERFAHAFSIKKHKVDPKTVGQFTGLHDKNKKEIYEGDIVKRHIEFWSDPADLGGKRFVSRDLIYFIEWGKWCYIKREKQDSPCTSFDGIEAKEFEVIGNIYENPELLNRERNDETSVATKSNG